ncbi:hypothetical protein AVEN_266502-2 [Araneus ventricosus]|uniref:Uncharacterized protein n=2 Tax=Araneus ventricosus TaxID=182803 RepID=A0A4Y2I3H6_ARAVE|nr:hypothetical protein AVEN_266502-2 [Araneus ventricosus]
MVLGTVESEILERNLDEWKRERKLADPYGRRRLEYRASTRKQYGYFRDISEMLYKGMILWELSGILKNSAGRCRVVPFPWNGQIHDWNTPRLPEGTTWWYVQSGGNVCIVLCRKGYQTCLENSKKSSGSSNRRL